MLGQPLVHPASKTWLRNSRVGQSGLRRRRRAPWGVETLESRTMLSTITVLSTADSGPGTLRAAIVEANLDQANDTITFAPSVTGTIELSSALPDLTTKMTIAGPGPTVLTVARNSASATPDFGIFTVNSSAIGVAISDLTIAGGVVTSGASAMENAGALTVTNCTIANNTAYQPGAGGPSGTIFNTATMSIVSSTIKDNSASGYEAGGGVFNTGTMSIMNSSIADNSAAISFGTGVGGGIYNSGTMTVSGSTIRGNSARAAIAGVGGGIYNSGTMSISSSAIAGNSSYCGYGNNAGGIGNFGTMSITGSTINNNSASAEYGGMAGGILAEADLTIINSTISGNSLDVQYGSNGGAGITVYSTLTLSLTYVTISNNLNTIDPNFPARESIAVELSSTTTVVDSVDSIFDASGGESVNVGSGAAFHSLGHNLFSDTPAFAVNATDLTHSNPLLGPLADHGGPTLTQALLPGSPARRRCPHNGYLLRSAWRGPAQLGPRHRCL